VPITAKLSRGFYERFGDDFANELVNLLNNVDAESRSNLRELNEANFARFEARLGQGFAEADAKLERRLAETETKLERRLGDLRAELIKWMFLFFTGSALANILLR
jgi:hypothetical protein